MIRHFATVLFCTCLLLGPWPQARAASTPAVASTKFMVVSAQRLATEAGAHVLREGGNAIDAAVAVGYALAVVYPCCGNIGGGGFMTIHLANGHDTFINFRETAPAAATANMFLDGKGQPSLGASLHGWRAVAVPGTVLGLDTALHEYGALSRAADMADAIRLARDGFTLVGADTDYLQFVAHRLREDPDAARIFLHPDGTALREGDKLVQPELATTLEAIAEDGPDAFYQGAIPAAVEQAARANGGVITAADFANYRATETPPLHCTYRDNIVLSAPPPSSGGVSLCEILNIVEGFDLHSMGFHSAESVHVMVEAMRLAYYDRNRDLGDPEFVKDPVARLISKEYAAKLRASIGPRATPSRTMPPLDHENTETTHYSVLDGAGNAVSVTFTLNAGFGAGVMAPGAGFLLNDEMDDFTVKADTPNLYGLIQGKANAIAPGKRPLSSMAPTIVMQNGRVRMVLGSPGGPRIITIVALVLSNVIDYDLPPQEAVDAARFHHQWMPDEIFAEPRAFSPDTERLLREMGYSVSTQTPWGAAELIVVGPQKSAPAPASSGNDAAVSTRMRPGYIYGASDPRRSAGAAIGN
jgi:gamma-glutamyltranspeptidase/glutathione hydrolase